MTMTEETKALVPAEAMTAIAVPDRDTFNAVSKSKQFLPRLQLMTSNSGACKDGKVGVNTYALVEGQDYTELGKTCNVLIISWRPKALDTSDEIMSVYDPESTTFQDIVARSERPNSGCMHGPEFLVWIPTIKRFATFFMGTPSARRESGGLFDRISGTATLDSKRIEGKKHTWYAPICKSYTGEMTPPPTEEIIEAANKFANPPESEVELAEETGEERAV